MNEAVFVVWLWRPLHIVHRVSRSLEASRVSISCGSDGCLSVTGMEGCRLCGGLVKNLPTAVKYTSRSKKLLHCWCLFMDEISCFYIWHWVLIQSLFNRVFRLLGVLHLGAFEGLTKDGV